MSRFVFAPIVMKKTIWISLVLIIALAAYLGFWPVPIAPVAWQAPAAPGHTGEHRANYRLAGLQQIDLRGEVGPEHVLAGADGMLYIGVASGRILRIKPDGSALHVFGTTGGRPLGMAFDATGNLVVADAIQGLLSIDTNGKVTQLASAVDGVPIRLANGVAIARNGKIYLTDSSTRFGPAQWGSTTEAAMLDIMEQSCTGRVLEYDPATSAVRVLAHGFSFANGIVLSADETSILVAESGRYRVWRVAVASARLDVRSGSPQAQVLLDNLPGYPDNLPGYPDNLTRGPDGRIWLGLAGQRNDLDKMAQSPSLRRLALRIPRPLWPVPPPYGHVLAFAEDGKILTDLQDPTGKSPLVTGVTEAADRMYLRNVNATSIGWMALEPQLGAASAD
jgi:sugar lactone lactonase YvrE